MEPICVENHMGLPGYIIRKMGSHLAFSLRIAKANLQKIVHLLHKTAEVVLLYRR